MGASQAVFLLRDENDPKYQKMAAAVQALKDAGIYQLPDELKEYFGIWETGEFEYGQTGLEAGCDRDDHMREVIVPYNAEMREGFDIHVDKLPEGVKVIRAYTSY